MCTIAILVNVADAPLVIAANRDELYARPTRGPEKLAEGVVGGIDELSGGTWLAVRRDGRFAAVTNQRPPVSADVVAAPGLRSRGLAVRELAMVPSVAAADAYVAALDPARYASMNLVWGSAAGATVAYFRRDVSTRELVHVPRGVHVLCNDQLGSRGFPRGERLREQIDAALARSTRLAELVPALEHALGDRTRSEPDAVPPSPHMPRELARELTAICIRAEGYGTRSATVAAFSADGVLIYDHADGPPDMTPFVDRRELLA